LEITRAKQKIGNDLTEGGIFSTLLGFAIPIILTNIVQQLYSIVDLTFLGRFVGSEGIVGVSAGSQLTDFLLSVGITMSAAGQIYISHIVGSKDIRRLQETAGTLISFLMICSIAISFVLIVFCKQLLLLLNCPQEAIPQTVVYMTILSVGVPFVFGFNAACAALRALGESRMPLLFAIIAAISKIALSLLLIVVFRMGIVGTGIATVFAEFASFAAAIGFLYKNQDKLGFQKNRLEYRIYRQHLKIILILGIPLLLQTAFIQLSQLWCNSQVNLYGMAASAANGIGTRLQGFVNVIMNGLATAAAAMIGQNMGAKKHERVKKIVLSNLMSNAVIGSLAITMSLTLAVPLYRIFSHDPVVIEIGVTYMRILTISFFLASILSAFQALVTGTGFAKLGLLVGFLDGVVCRIGFSLLFLYTFHAGVTSYFWGTALARLLPVAICMAYFFSGKWRTRVLLSESSPA